MPALNFQARFADAVASGAKAQTIRATRKQPIKVGDTLHLFTGMRTKACRRLRAPVKCTSAASIVIEEARVWIDGEWQSLEQIKALSARDGFMDPVAFVEFFRFNHGLPFHGQLIQWTP